jgi:hypothetical protein
LTNTNTQQWQSAREERRKRSGNFLDDLGDKMILINSWKIAFFLLAWRKRWKFPHLRSCFEMNSAFEGIMKAYLWDFPPPLSLSLSLSLSEDFLL